MLEGVESKTVHKDEEGDKRSKRRKRSKTLSQIKPVKNISKNLQILLEISPIQESFRIKGR